MSIKVSNLVLPERDEIGPERIYYWYDPEVKVQGVSVIDTTAYGYGAGGTRMVPDVSVVEVAGLARAMTYKWASLDLPIGGAKNGIWADNRITGPQREAIFRAYGRHLKNVIGGRILLSTGTDIGTFEDDLGIAFQTAGITAPKPVFVDGVSLEFLTTGFGVISSAEEACKCLGTSFGGASIAVEGFGKVGQAVARYGLREGAKIVAVSTTAGAIYNKNGLDVDLLFKLRDQFGSDMVKQYPNAEHISDEELFYLPVDILIPGARPSVITMNNVGKVNAKMIVEAANIPITPEAEEVLFSKGIYVVPDFIANSGGILQGLIQMLGGDTPQVFDGVKKAVQKSTRDVLEAAKANKVNPSKWAKEKAKEKVLKARAEGKVLGSIELRKVCKEKLGL